MNKIQLALTARRLDATASPLCCISCPGAVSGLYHCTTRVNGDYARAWGTTRAAAAALSRVIVLAYKELEGLEGPELRRLPRAEAESGLTFAGFAVFACPLKPGAAAVPPVTVGAAGS